HLHAGSQHGQCREILDVTRRHGRALRQYGLGETFMASSKVRFSNTKTMGTVMSCTHVDFACRSINVAPA
ncbi:MAG: hypothetical protein ACKVH7_10620, partial [Alphaproteobacteria bacterium]